MLIIAMFLKVDSIVLLSTTTVTIDPLYVYLPFNYRGPKKR